MNDQDQDQNQEDLDPISKIFGLDTPTPVPTFTDLDPNTGNLNERASVIVDPSSGELVPRKVDEVTPSDLEKEERIEDLHIDAQLEGIHNTALEAYHHQHRMSQEVDPKFSARNAEVAAQYLNIALNAVNSRVDAKFKRQKIRIAKADVGTPNTLNQNVIVADRNELLRTLLSNKEKTIDGD